MPHVVQSVIEGFLLSYEPLVDFQRTDVFVRNIIVISSANLIDLIEVGSKILLGGFI